MRAKKDAAKQALLPTGSMDKFEIFSINLRLLRQVNGIKSAEDLGKKLGMKKHYRISDLELRRGGPPKLEEVIIIADFFKISIDNLLYKKGTINF